MTSFELCCNRRSGIFFTSLDAILYIHWFFEIGWSTALRDCPGRREAVPSCTERYDNIVILGIRLDLLYVGLNMLEQAVQEIFSYVFFHNNKNFFPRTCLLILGGGRRGILTIISELLPVAEPNTLVCAVIGTRELLVSGMTLQPTEPHQPGLSYML